MPPISGVVTLIEFQWVRDTRIETVTMLAVAGDCQTGASMSQCLCAGTGHQFHWLWNCCCELSSNLFHDDEQQTNWTCTNRDIMVSQLQQLEVPDSVDRSNTQRQWTTIGFAPNDNIDERRSPRVDQRG